MLFLTVTAGETAWQNIEIIKYCAVFGIIVLFIEIVDYEYRLV